MLGRSLMNIKKSNGPRIEPWGTPLLTCIRLDETFSFLTNCLRLS